jgi:hypothetical protein
MRKWMLSVLVLAMVGMVAVEAQAGGGRRGRSWNRPTSSSSSVNPSSDQATDGSNPTEPTTSVRSASWDSSPSSQSAPAHVYYSSSRCVGGG